MGLSLLGGVSVWHGIMQATLGGTPCGRNRRLKLATSANGFSVNGFSVNGFSANGFSANGVESVGTAEQADLA